MLSDRVSAIKPSPTLAMNTRAKEMKASGVDVISFGVGEPDFDTPENIKEAAIKAIRDGFTKYTPVDGIPPLKEAIADKLRADNSVEYRPEEIIVSCGAKHSLYNIAQALFNRGDEVIIPAPYWVSYPAQVLLNDAKPVFVETHEEDSFMLRPEELEKHITGRTRALILNYPSNPTGLTYNRAALEAIAGLALRHDFYIISDEIYEKILYDGAGHICFPSLGADIRQKTILVNGLSKSHAMTGWRIGYAAGPSGIIKAMSKIQGQSTSNPSSISQAAAVEALRGPQDFISGMVSEFDKRRRYIIDELNSIEGISCIVPDGAFYAFPGITGLLGKTYNGRKVDDSSGLSLYLLEEAHIALVPGIAFGAEGYIRMSYATSMDNIREGIKRLKTAVAGAE
ncbi:aspartate aminotransferase [bacterium BMS3Bbin05]|nr:aspartate aminotransferase [bacterium BMS3Bbin05]HDO21558.1 pyridoxal phosphate-dependent aminotransferase [Nitrospirota bacterium]HDZ87394.1 pyridoxal phosphate-dependent aminotransferase [Nitrospirota bacterium]